ncbi:uncharacterized protein [Channa argus]|uniref:uncharacterized protein isoform X1 n=1 Tax=Channa argus TaxID=215402 RepID=UPI00351FE96F
MGSHLTTTQEKCYDPRDSTLTFVDREDELDFLCEGFQSRRALMSCGHAVTPMSLTNWCRRLLDEGKSRFVCGQSGCNVEWPYAEVCKMALLTPEEMKYFKKAMASNSTSGYFETKRQCLRERMRQNPHSHHYGNTKESLKTLRSCADITPKCVRGFTACPSIRACPTCGILLHYDNTMCKNVTCPRCKVKFCFVCLKLTTECMKTSQNYMNCLSGVAPRQTSIPVWQKK